MANRWETAPLVEQSKQSGQDNRWSEAPLVDQSFVNDGSVGPSYARGGQPLDGGKDAAVAGFFDGMPVVGPYVLGGLQRSVAGLRAPFTDKTYAEELADVQKYDKQVMDANPGSTTAGRITGGVIGSAGMVAAAPTLFGAGGGGLLGKTFASGVSGATIGGADSAVRSDGDWREAGKGAFIGGLTGGAAPLAGQAIGAGARSFMDMVARRGAAKAAEMAPGALARLGRAAAADGLDAPALQTRLAELGPDAMIMDLGPNLQRQAGAIAATPGRGQEIVRNAVNQRQMGANQRIIGELNDTLGPVRSPIQINQGIQEGQRATGPAYAQSFADGVPVQTDYIANALEQQGRTLRGPQQRAVQQVRQMLNEAGRDNLDTNPYTLFQTRNAIDGMLAGEQNPQVIRVLTQTRQQIDENLSRNVPGIKMADAQYEELARQNHGLNRGSQVLDSGKTAPRPEDLANEMTAGVQPQGLSVGPSGEAFRMTQGARAEIDRIVGTNVNDVVALNRIVKGEGDWNRDRLATLFGPSRADRIINVLDREKAFANTRHIVGQNSETAARSAAMRELGQPDIPEFGVREGYMSGGVLGAGRSAAVRGFEKAAKTILGSGADRRNESLANAISSNRQVVIDAIMRAQAVRNVPQSEINQITRAALMSGGLLSSPR
ncbi:hypothetical protein [Phyllobacterium sp. OV277]|uniref:hypothetical protein n=1 Tax=Phyllobacterium sp. OV277 TaxID=1882772 RepID=UPI000884CC67|nr:hypothetical protein [Phyllobacterium sp. OV277]SDP08280.1 hypothetical protein SAMN05443582_103354 [Phyllobacterium sp. OV277]